MSKRPVFDFTAAGYSAEEWQALSPDEKHKARRKAWRLNNKERTAVHQRRHRRKEAAKEKGRERNRKWRASMSGERKEEIREYKKNWRVRWYANLSDEEYRRLLDRGNEWKRAQRAKMKPEDIRKQEDNAAIWRPENRRAIDAGYVAIQKRIKAIVPATLPMDVRDDVISDILMALYDGEFPVAAIETEGKKFVGRHFAKREWFSTLSLDAPVPGMDGTTYLDRLEAQDAAY